MGTSVDAHLLPGTTIFSNDSATILNYISTDKNPIATIIPARTVLSTKPAPFMAAFSSRGPNGLDPNILKPDITTPGLDILAAWIEDTSPTYLADDHRVVKYNILSGTSMSCPHVAAAAALVKAIHPNWSSAAIKSALLTTAKVNDNMGTQMTDALGNPATPFQYGVGHFEPTNSADPGLVYNTTYREYLIFLCNFSTGVSKFEPSFQCPEQLPSSSNLNYPSLANAKFSGTMTVNRTVTNVGGSGGVYTLTIEKPVGLLIWFLAR